MIIEKETTYAFKIQYLNNLTFDKICDIANKFVEDLPTALINDLSSRFEKNVDQIDSEPQLFIYLYSFGKMHQAKLNAAFENIPTIFFEQPEINIIDYGCGQAIGTMCYADFLTNKGITQKVKRVTLIEPSEICLKRAALHTSTFLPDAEITTISQEFNYLYDIVCDEKIPTLHILSNVLDLKFDLGNFAQVISVNLLGYNQFACVGPYFNTQSIDRLMDDFAGFFFERKDNFNKIFDKYQLNSEKSWTAHIRCFSVGELSENYSPEVTEADIKNGIEDEFGVLYSMDGKRLLKCKNEGLEDYEIKDGTIVICNSSFYYEKQEQHQFFSASFTYNGLSLKKITIPDSVTKIGVNAFWGCESLQQIIIPEGSTEHFKQILSDDLWQILTEKLTSNVTNLDIEKRIGDAYCVNNNFMIDKNTNTLLRYIGKERYVSIPENVNIIGEHAFCECEEIEEIYIPNSVTTIKKYAFRCCYSLLKINLPHSITTIESEAFLCCDSIRHILIPNSVSHIGDAVFKGCTSLEEIIIEDNKLFLVRNHLLIDLKNKKIIAHFGKDNKEIIPTFVTTIGTNAFWQQNRLEQITIPNSITKIEDSAFEGCDLHSITIPQSVKYIGNNAFYGNQNLEKIYFNSIPFVEKYSFYDGECLYCIVIPKDSYMKFCKMLPEELHCKLSYYDFDNSESNQDENYVPPL